ncbi:MAG TPA: hypothetical protein VGC07_10470 [Granulicella sp.]
MRVKIAAVRSGTDPVGPLPEAAFHRWLEEPLICPKCDASYNLVVDYDRSVDRHFEDESRGPIQMLKRTIARGHEYGHQVTHFETEGVVVRAFRREEAGG